ncbi:DUF296 domain-containing protein [Azorhizobium oxalatiphilum]|uniref:DUF296 domain-containing protein n=1 Tax=Azorhizobium oxalatiphilum TaxID=980631 RepID=A0A917BSM5_9HYPH|nr:DUF296 domain-containing protein [Azorhizobium oxalatiphilum]GGF55304.1 DUF296 domain-containing protein [Azorhizobium oxalatiphilum]
MPPALQIAAADISLAPPMAPAQDVLSGIRHPGRPADARVEAVETGIVPIVGSLRVGHDVTSEVHRLFREAGCRGGVVQLQGGRCQPFQFVGPAYASDDVHAVWYSTARAPADGAAIAAATAIVGWRDGAPFLHCHGTWDIGGAALAAGHMLTSDSIVSEPIAITGFGTRTACFESLPDEETNFTLYTPRGDSMAGGSLLLRLRPHEDLCGAIEAACRRHGIASALVYGIGSLISPRFEDGEGLACRVTEIAIERGVISDGVAHLDIAAVDVDGTVRNGRVRRGENPVCVTFELVVVGLGGWGRA